MFYVTKELLKQLSPEDQDLVMENGITMDEMDAMSPEEKEKLMGDSAVKAPTTKEDMGDEMMSSPDDKVDDEMKLAKPVKYGDEDQFESKLTEDGRMEEFPNSKKNAISDFGDAADQGMALLDRVANMPQKKKPKKKIKQEELDGEVDDVADDEEDDE